MAFFCPRSQRSHCLRMQDFVFSHHFSKRWGFTAWSGTAPVQPCALHYPCRRIFCRYRLVSMIMKNLTFTAGRVLFTLSMAGCAAVLGWHLWSFYMEAPWTRDAHVRADIIRLAPDVSGPVAEVLVSDNAQVEKGTPLFRIETDRFEPALREAEAQVTATRAAAELAKTDFERYQLLASKEAASLKERQYAESRMYQAEAAYQSALVARDLARLNLERTTVRAPASGAITNFSLRRGNYVVSGNAVGALVEEESVYVAGYFEETKLPGSTLAIR